MQSIIKFKPNRGPCKVQVKAKVDSHLLLKEEVKARLNNILGNKGPGVVELEWDTSNTDKTKQRDEFLRENGLHLNPDDVQCKWSTRHSIPTKVVKQCICGSYRKHIVGPTSREPTTRYPYVECLAFVTLFLRKNEVCGIAGYLDHLEACRASRPRRDPVYRLMPRVKESVEIC
jgi:hypothetical protein